MNYHVSVHRLVRQLGLVVRATSFQYQKPWVPVPSWLLTWFVLISSGFLNFLALHVKRQLVCLWPVGILFYYFIIIISVFFFICGSKCKLKGYLYELPVWLYLWSSDQFLDCVQSLFSQLSLSLAVLEEVKWLLILFFARFAQFLCLHDHPEGLLAVKSILCNAFSLQSVQV